MDRSKQGRLSKLIANRRGAVLIEAAIVLPMVIVLLLGIVSYGGWFMAAHSLQQAANEAARSAIAGLDDDERLAIVKASLAKSVLHSGTLQSGLVDLETSNDAGFYTVKLTYDIASSNLYKVSLVPLPAPKIERDAIVELPSA